MWTSWSSSWTHCSNNISLIDIAAKQGTMIKSSGSGTVTMAEDDLYYTGGTVIMDHGHGISTIYSHIENVMVSVGDKINQGDIIGTVGSTGRSTGPHLDFRVNWFQTRLDPMSIINWIMQTLILITLVIVIVWVLFRPITKKELDR